MRQPLICLPVYFVQFYKKCLCLCFLLAFCSCFCLTFVSFLSMVFLIVQKFLDFDFMNLPQSNTTKGSNYHQCHCYTNLTKVACVSLVYSSFGFNRRGKKFRMKIPEKLFQYEKSRIILLVGFGLVWFGFVYQFKLHSKTENMIVCQRFSPLKTLSKSFSWVHGLFRFPSYLFAISHLYSLFLLIGVCDYVK